MSIRKSCHSSFNIHLCGPLSPDRTCRDYGLSRVHVNTPWYHVDFPYWPLHWWPNEDILKHINQARLAE